MLALTGRFGLFAAFMCFIAAAQAQQQGLSRAEVKKYLHTRIAVAELQSEYKANAEQYGNVVHAFYQARDRLVVERGYASGEAFDAMKRRIWTAYNSMNEYERLEQNRADWPAVRHYRDTIDAIVAWYNGNTDKRPVLE